MKTKNIYQCLALLAMALTTAACQKELNEETTDPKTGEKVNMIIRATQGMAPQTRTSYEDKLGVGTTGNVVVKWEGGTATDAPVEKIKVFGYANDASEFTTTPEELSSAPKSRSTDGLSITFPGTVTKADNYLAVYPAENCTLDQGTIDFNFLNQEQDCTSGKEMAHLKKYDIMIGQPAATGTNNFTFVHKAIMLCFDLTLPGIETANKVTLKTNITNGIMTKAFIQADISNFNLLPYDETQEISLGITKHNSDKLKAYMMIPTLDVNNATLTIIVTTVSGKIYEGKLKTNENTPALIPGKCYTLKPNTLTLSNTITVPPVTAGNLEEALKNITPVAGQTELILTGTVNDTDITALGTFLKDTKAKDITTLDLSALNGVTQVAGFATCENVVTVILPTGATAIGDNAFEGCKALTTIIQNEPASTRASISSKLKTIGNYAFKGCTSMTEMLLHGNITKVGNNAFEGCTAMKALVFEGRKSVGSGTDDLNLGTNILTGCTNADLKIFLPAINDAAVATTYNTALEKPIYYNFLGYGSADAENKVNATNYTILPHDNGMDGFTQGGEWGK